jgi:hypothetical protein
MQSRSRLLVTLVIALQACGGETGPAVVSMRVDSVSADEGRIVSANLRCSPTTLRGDDTLTLHLDVPHGPYFIAYPPDSTPFLVVFPGEGSPDRTQRRSLMSSDSFRRMSEVKIIPRRLTAAVWVFERDTNEVLFTKPGEYRLQVGSDMETDGPRYTECNVRYLGEE